MDYKNLILVFPPGAGSNHLANMLSTHPDFMPLSDSNNYVSELDQLYQSNCDIHHFTPNSNLTWHWLDERIPALKQTPRTNIFIAHFGELLDVRHLLDQLPGVHTLVFALPEYHLLPSRVFFNNMKTHNYFYLEQRSLYQSAVVKQLCSGWSSDEIRYNDLFTPSLSSLEQQMNIKLPELCHSWHTLWYNKIQTWIKENS